MFSYTTILEVKDQDMVAVIPQGINDVAELLNALYERLNLPGYFGFNWNALSDCLRDLHWVDSFRLVLFHEDLPGLKKDELKIYLDILNEAVQDWCIDEEHRLIVIFPPTTRERVAAALTEVDIRSSEE